ncbi:MAG: SDR family NAD(P)-dependent oxidoreductase, partial [Planctomycetota bacterium]
RRPGVVEQSSELSSEALIGFAQAWRRRTGDAAPSSSEARPRLTILTRGAQSSDGIEDVAFCQTPLIGLGRVFASELADFQTRLVDLPPTSNETQFGEAIAELQTDDQEDEILYRDGERFVRRFVPHRTVKLPGVATRQVDCRLVGGSGGGIDEMRYRVAEPDQAMRGLGDGDVEIKVSATGLNFSDVMKALRLYPGQGDGPASLGAECCGRVTAVAADVEDVSVGDEVIAVAWQSFATKVVVDRRLMTRKPSGLSDAEAAASPIAFLTARYALEECARIRDGESVLVHSASGGVGLAAIQFARRNGAKLFATAGTEEKRRFVRDLGVEWVFDSRGLDFDRQIREANGGRGVDVVLNSLPGEALRRGVELLNSGGRFLEIGKRDIYDDMALGLSPFRNNLSFFAIDLDQQFQSEMDQMGSLLRGVGRDLSCGDLEPIPVQCFEADQVTDAFRTMQQAKHIGKIVVKYDGPPSVIFPATSSLPRVRQSKDTPAQALEPSDPIFRRDRSYWVAGGLGGFGLRIAAWMASRGAGQLVLGGRTGKVSEQQADVLREIEASGTSVSVMATDVSERSQVRRTIERIQNDLSPLAGIVHTAMVLEDRMVDDLDAATLQRVLRPKMLGAWNLHVETSEIGPIRDSLEHFILFSSLSSIFGHAGQANYAAANATLDGLAAHRRVQGLPALVVNWGHVGDVGYLAERRELGDRLERQGVMRFSLSEATGCLETLIHSGAVQASVLRMDWSRWRGIGTSDQVSPRFAHLVRQGAFETDSELDLASLRNVDDSVRQDLIAQAMSDKLTSLLGLPEHQIDRQRPLLELGMDSLMAVELRNWMDHRLKVAVPISEMMGASSIDRLSSFVSTMMMDQQPPGDDVHSTAGANSPPQPSSEERMLAEIETMDEAQLDRLLMEMSASQDLEHLGQSDGSAS